MQKHPKEIKSGMGTVKTKSNYYTGLALTLKTHYGEVSIIAPSIENLKAQADLIMPAGFTVDESRIQEVCIFSAQKLDNQHITHSV